MNHPTQCWPIFLMNYLLPCRYVYQETTHSSSKSEHPTFHNRWLQKVALRQAISINCKLQSHEFLWQFPTNVYGAPANKMRTRSQGCQCWSKRYYTLPFKNPSEVKWIQMWNWACQKCFFFGFSKLEKTHVCQFFPLLFWLFFRAQTLVSQCVTFESGEIREQVFFPLLAL